MILFFCIISAYIYIKNVVLDQYPSSRTALMIILDDIFSSLVPNTVDGPLHMHATLIFRPKSDTTRTSKTHFLFNLRVLQHLYNIPVLLYSAFNSGKFLTLPRTVRHCVKWLHITIAPNCACQAESDAANGVFSVEKIVFL
jgi:hypothetical protein